MKRPVFRVRALFSFHVDATVDAATVAVIDGGAANHWRPCRQQYLSEMFASVASAEELALEADILHKIQTV